MSRYGVERNVRKGRGVIGDKRETKRMQGEERRKDEAYSRREASDNLQIS